MPKRRIKQPILTTAEQAMLKVLQNDSRREVKLKWRYGTASYLIGIKKENPFGDSKITFHIRKRR